MDPWLGVIIILTVAFAGVGLGVMLLDSGFNRALSRNNGMLGKTAGYLTIALGAALATATITPVLFAALYGLVLLVAFWPW